MTTPKVKMYVLKNGDGYSRPGAEGDRGCVGCSGVAKDKDTLLVDARGRYWHDHCLAEFAAEIERKGETRLKKGGDLLRDRAIAGGGRVVYKEGT